MTRIKLSKDNLLKDSYVWILSDPAFIDWRDNNDTQLLWIKGDPGKGKTMLMIGLIEELLEQLKARPESGILSYFFCQGTDFRLNNAVAILKGLIYQLADQHTALIRHLQKKYDSKGRQFSEDTNRLCFLWTILSDMLHDPSLARVYLMIDALDECDSELSQLLDLIAHNTSEPPSRVKWLVSSRSQSNIEIRLRPDKLRSKISLELNSCHISHAVNTFIDFKVSELAKTRYTSQLQKEVTDYLHENAKDTFLWVALVCKELRDVQARKTLSALQKFPPGLHPLYERMMNQIWCLEDSEDIEFCRRILCSVTLACRPVRLKELASTADLQGSPDDLQSLNELVNLCGSFLTVREETVYFIHQSAKDYFSTPKGARIFPSGQAEEHCKIAFRSLQVMSNTLKRDICGLQMPGALLDELNSVNLDPLAHIRYSCCYWVSHLRDASHLPHDQIGLCDGGKVHIFFQKHFLHWLEALSLMGNLSEGVRALEFMLETMLTVSDST